MPPTWSGFQSIFQLATALNIGFTAVLTAFGGNVERIGSSINRSVVLAKSFRDEARMLESELDPGDFNKSMFGASENYLASLDLQRDFQVTYAGLWVVENAYFRLACVLSGVASYCLLFISSIVSAEQISPSLEFLGVILSLPVLVYVVVTGYQSFRLSRAFETRRRGIENKANEGILGLKSKSA